MPENSGLMRGKRGLILGVANNRSITWGIARACRDHGADLAFTYQGDALKSELNRWPRRSTAWSSGIATSLSRLRSMQYSRGCSQLGARSIFWCTLLLSSDRGQLDGRYIDTTEDNFIKTMVVSCYSFTALAQRAES